MQGDTLVEHKDARAICPKQKKNNKNAKNEYFRDVSTETKNKKITKPKHYQQPAPLANYVQFENSKRICNVTCPDPECIGESKPVKKQSKKISKKIKHVKPKNDATLLKTNGKLEMKAQNPVFCHEGPCSGTDVCSRQHECACRGNRKRKDVDNTVKNKGNVSDSKRKQKNRVTSLVHDQKQNKNAKVEDVFAEGPNQHQGCVCKSGICAKAMKTKRSSFFCRCKLRKHQAITSKNNEGSDIIFNASNESKPIQSNTTIAKLRKTISCLCRKYSEKLKEKRHSTIANSPNNVKANTGEVRERNNLFKCFCKKKKTQPESNEQDLNQKRQEISNDKCDLAKVKKDSKTSKGKDVQPLSKIVRKPLDTSKKTSSMPSQSGSEECQGITPSEFKKMQSPKVGLKISMKETDKKHLRICRCKNCKRKKKRQPTKGTKGFNDNECGDASCGKHTQKTNNSSCGVCCKCKKEGSTTAKFQNFMCASLANLMRKRKARKLEAEDGAKTLKGKGNDKKKDLKSKNMKSKSGSIYKCHHECQCRLALKKKNKLEAEDGAKTLKGKGNGKKKDLKSKNMKSKSGSICKCHHECQCRLALKKKKKKPKVNLKSSKKKNKKKNQKQNKEALRDNAKFSKEVRQKERQERKTQSKMQRQEMQELKRLSEGKETMEDTNCLADFFLGIFKTAFNIVKTIAFVIVSFIIKPKASWHYLKGRVKDPVGTYERIKKWWRAKWYLKKLQMAKTVGGSDNMSIFSDTIKDSSIYQAFASKGKTKKERQAIALENKRRKRRIRKRRDEAVFNCKHNLLSTLRKTPCLWVFHVCPGCYPQCLSMLALWSKFANLMLFCLAFAFWTPCILLCELSRGLMCCTMCME